ncbi:hypothetical protein [Paenibacillus silvisoli]|uniref:hypothetical protein n=1 Tax=Paenibacillus silvisoli TaxID=3110539 RepID=UPI002805464A|nr:hypothetical protein [Paenibacillus silvisoli]
MGKIALYSGLLLLSLAITGCESLTGKLSSFEENQIDAVRAEEHDLLVDCSEEVNRGKKGDIADVGYLLQRKSR